MEGEGEGGEDGNAHDDSMHIAMLTHSEERMHADNSEKTATIRPNRKWKLCNIERRLTRARPTVVHNSDGKSVTVNMQKNKGDCDKKKRKRREPTRQKIVL